MNAGPPFFAAYQDRVERELLRLVPGGDDPVHQAMAHTLFAPSKRVRAVLTLLSAELCGRPAPGTLVAAGVMEMVHASSLILDDLPSMDDVRVRRGRPANHVVFGEAIAILAAFGLLNASYGVLAREFDTRTAVALTALVSDAVGTAGLIGGQAADLLAGDRAISAGALERIHRGKTGALFGAAATAGALTAQGPPGAVAALQEYARHLGLAFQITDDLLDVEGRPELTGKTARADAGKRRSCR
jgi:geranylgeranyl pyrophosphate synthase